MKVAYSEVPASLPSGLNLEMSPDPRRVTVSPRCIMGIPVPQHMRSRLAIVASLVAFVVTVGAMLFIGWVPYRAKVALDMESASEVPAGNNSGQPEVGGFALMFKQCGGEAWTGPNCCEPGCACVMHTKFYSQCVPPRGMAECSTEAAVHEVKRAQAKKDMWLPLSATRAKTAKLAAENVSSLMDALATARMARDKAERQGELLIAKDEKAQKEQVRTKKKADKAAALRAKKVAENNTLAKEVAVLVRENALRDAGKCAGMFGQCGGANFNTGGACCQKGCRCVFKDNYYSQCEAHKDDGFCNVKRIESQEQALFSKAAKLRVVAASAVRAHNAAHKAAASAKERASDAAKAAKPARIALAQAEKRFALKKQAASLAARLATDDKAAAQRADLQAAIWSEAVIAWGKAKDPNACRWPRNNASSPGHRPAVVSEGAGVGGNNVERGEAEEADGEEEEKKASSESSDGQEAWHDLARASKKHQATIVDLEDMANTAREEGSTSAVADAGVEASAATSHKGNSSNILHSDVDAGLRFLMKRLMGETKPSEHRDEAV